MGKKQASKTPPDDRPRSAQLESFSAHLRDRGRLVVPAQIRKLLRLGEGDQLLVTVQPDGSLRLVSPRQVARQTRGLYQQRRRRSLADELIAERRAEAFR